MISIIKVLKMWSTNINSCKKLGNQNYLIVNEYVNLKIYSVQI